MLKRPENAVLLLSVYLYGFHLAAKPSHYRE